MDHLPKYSADEVVEALRRREELTASGHTLAEVAAELGISRETLTNWRRDFRRMSPAEVDDARETRQREAYSSRRKKVKGSTRLRPYAPTLSVEDRRTQILDGGLKVLVDQGAHAVSLHTVGQQLNLSRPPIQRQFPDSEQLRHSVIDREVTAAVDELAAIIKPGRSAGAGSADALPVVVTQFVDAVLATPYRWEAMAQLVRSPIASLRMRARPALHAVVVEYVRDRNSLNRDYDVVAHLILGVLLEAADLLYADPTSGAPDGVVATLNTAMSALMASPGSDARGALRST